MSSDELGAAFPFSGETQLVVGTMLLRGMGFAATARLSANVVLLRQNTREQIRAERGDFLFDLGDPGFKCLGLPGHDLGSLASVRGPRR